MSTIAAGEAVEAATTAKRRGVPGLRGTGWVGHLCAGIILFAILIAIIGPSIAPHDPNFVQLQYAYVGPVDDHYLGFDGRGRDLLSRLLVGAQTAVFGAIAVAMISVLLGTLLAITAAWLRGWFDTVMGGLLDILFAFPALLIAVMSAAIFGPSLKTAVIALSIAYTPYIARVLRGAALRERAQPYVAALEVQGLAAVPICVRHLIPNILGLVVAQATILFGYAMVDLAAISFIGLGVQSPQADWGVMVSDGRAGVLTGYPLESLSAGLCIVVVVVAVNLLGERLAEQSAQR